MSEVVTTSALLEHFERISEAPGAVARLRRFVLELAFRGRLVAQNPNDEPITRVLETLSPRLPRADEGEETEFLHPLPVSWRWAALGSIADFAIGRTPRRNEPSCWNTGDHAWVSIADMVDGGVIETTKETVSEAARCGVFRGDPLPRGTVLMSFKLTIGKISILGIPAFHNEAIISLAPRLRETLPYLFLALPFDARQGETKSAIKGSTLNRGSLASIRLPLPPLAEQHRIVAKVDELMALCDELEAAQAKREKRRDRLVAASLHALTNGESADELANAQAREQSVRFYLNHLPRLTTRPEHIQQLRQAVLELAGVPRAARTSGPEEASAIPPGQLLNRRGLPHAAQQSLNSDDLGQLPQPWRPVRLTSTLRQLSIRIQVIAIRRRWRHDPDPVGARVQRPGWLGRKNSQAGAHGVLRVPAADLWLRHLGHSVCAKRAAWPAAVHAEVNRFTFSHTIFVVKPSASVFPPFLLWTLRRDAVIRWLTEQMNDNTGVSRLERD